MIRAVAIIAAALALMAWAASSDGMDRCQEIHSFDTCFESLNR